MHVQNQITLLQTCSISEELNAEDYPEGLVIPQLQTMLIVKDLFPPDESCLQLPETSLNNFVIWKD